MKQEIMRLEIVGNHAVEDDLLEHLEASFSPLHYTLIADVQGGGTCGKRLGDGVWPELNFLLILNLPAADISKAIEAVREMKRLYPLEGIKAWSYAVTEEL